MRSHISIPFFSMLVLQAGCAEHWQAGTWVESDFAVRDDPCDWATDIVEPAEPNQYTLGTPPDPNNDSGDDPWIEHGSFADAQEWIQARSDDFWNYCFTYSGAFSSSLELDCPVAIQLVQSSLSLDASVTESCDADDLYFHSYTNGLLVREGEAFMNHHIEMYCESWDEDSGADLDTGAGGGDDTGTEPGTEENPSCSMTYSSWLKRQ